MVASLKHHDVADLDVRLRDVAAHALVRLRGVRQADPGVRVGPHHQARAVEPGGRGTAPLIGRDADLTERGLHRGPRLRRDPAELRLHLGHAHRAGVGVPHRAVPAAVGAAARGGVHLGLLDRGQRLHDRLSLLELRQRARLGLLHLLQQRLLGGQFAGRLGLLPVQQLLLGLDVAEHRLLAGVQLALERRLVQVGRGVRREHHLHGRVHRAGAVLRRRLGPQGGFLLVDRALLTRYLVLEQRNLRLERLLLALSGVVLLSRHVRCLPVRRHLLGGLAERQLGGRLRTCLSGDRDGGGSRRGEHRHAGAVGLLGAAV